jgi:hypothetical protein
MALHESLEIIVGAIIQLRTPLGGYLGVTIWLVLPKLFDFLFGMFLIRFLPLVVYLFSALIYPLANGSDEARPNIVFIFIDDQG